MIPRVVEARYIFGRTIWLRFDDGAEGEGAAVFGKDELRSVSPRTINTSSIMAEAEYLVLPWVMPTFRFEKTNFSDGRRNVLQMIPAVNFMVRANVRVFAEGHFFNHIQAAGRDRTGLNEGLIRLEFFF